MLIWDKLVEILVGTITATVVILLALSIYDTIDISSKAQQKKLLATDAAYVYKVNSATNIGHINSYNPKDKDANGIPDYLEDKVATEAPTASVLDQIDSFVGNVYSLSDLTNPTNQILSKMAQLLNTSIVTHDNHIYFANTNMSVTDLQEFKAFMLKWVLSGNNTHFTVEKEYGPDGVTVFGFVLREIANMQDRIAYNTGDILDYYQVQSLLELAQGKFDATLVSLEGNTYMQAKDQPLHMLNLVGTGFLNGDYAKIEVERLDGITLRIALNQVEYQVIGGGGNQDGGGGYTGIVIDPNGDAPVLEIPPVPEFIDPTQNINWAAVCLGNRENYVKLDYTPHMNSIEKLANGSLLVKNNMPVILNNHPSTLFKGKDLNDYLDYLMNFSGMKVLTKDGTNIAITTPTQILTHINPESTYHIMHQSTAGISTYTLVEVDVLTSDNGSFVELDAVKDLVDMPIVPIHYTIVTPSGNHPIGEIDGSTLGEMTRITAKDYLSTFDSSTRFFTHITMNTQGQLVYELHPTTVTSDFIENGVISASTLNSLLAGDWSDKDIRFRMLNNVTVDKISTQDFNAGPNFIADFIKGNATTSQYKINYEYESPSSRTIKAIILSEIDPIQHHTSHGDMSQTTIGNPGFYYIDYNKYVNKGHFKCNN